MTARPARAWRTSSPDDHDYDPRYDDGIESDREVGPVDPREQDGAAADVAWGRGA
jgi:hypothetical protein